MDCKIIDAHCDTLSELMTKGGTLADNTLCVSLRKLKRCQGYIQFFAAWLPDESKKPLQEALFLIDRFYSELEQNQDSVMQILCAEDFEKAFSQRKIGAMLTLENGNCLEGQLSNLRLFYRLGVRAMTLTWNGANEIGDGVEVRSGGGLSDFGREVVCEMNRLGIMIDVSHLSEKGFWDVLELSKAPVMASHSNAMAVTSHKRNLSDEQIHALSQSGGIIGLNFYPAFLSNREEATLWDCFRHIEHILSVGGENCLGLGSDFDGFSAPMTKGMAGPEDYGALFLFLEKQGCSKSFVQKLSHGNFLRYAKRVLK